ncbi:MAG: hypothetical protein ACRDRI_22095 [Pseudonocardiaceae bacterium]
MNEHPATAPGAREEHPMVGAPRWGVSSTDHHTHTIDADAEHPDAVYLARCGQLLFMGTNLYDEPPPDGWVCLFCLRWTDR